MASRYWVGGTATWDATAGTKWATTSGGAGGSAIPTAADDVFFDGSSGAVTVTLSSSSVARSIDCFGFTGTISHPAATTISLGDATAGAGNRILRLVSGMTYTLGNASTSALTLATTSATQQTVTTGTKTVGNLTISGAGCSILLSDGLTSSGTITHSAGTFDTGSQTISASIFNYGNATTRTLTLGSSTINVSSGTTAYTGTAVTNLTMTANTATVNATGNAPTGNVLNLSTKNWNGLSFNVTGGVVATNTATISSSGATVNNLTITGTADQNCLYAFNGNITVSGTFTVTGNSAVNRVILTSSVAGTARTITAATTSISNVDFADITGAGAGSWAITSGVVGDWGGNSGVTVTTPATQTRDSTGAAAWSVAARWTSRVPLPQDDVVINASSGSISTTDVLILGKSIDFTGYTSTITHTTNASTYKMFGGLTLGSGMSFGASVNTFNIYLMGRGTYTITSNGKTPFPANSNQSVSINAFGGTYSLSDALTLSATAALSLNILAGSFATNNYNVTCGRFVATGTLTRSVTLGTSIFSLGITSGSAAIAAATTGLTWSAYYATFNITTASASTRSIDLQTLSIGKLSYTVAGSTGIMTITSSGTINDFSFSDTTNARTLQLTAGVTLTCIRFNVNGTLGKLMTLQTSSAGTAATLSIANGITSVDYLSIKDSTATGGAAFYAGVNSTNVSGNTGWTFTASPTDSNMLLTF